MIILKAITPEELQQQSFFLYIYTPFCGTCHIAKAMLEKIESTHETELFYQMNASYYADFMHELKIESVPCLLIKKDGKFVEKIYAFRSIGNIYSYLLEYNPEMFSN